LVLTVKKFLRPQQRFRVCFKKFLKTSILERILLGFPGYGILTGCGKFEGKINGIWDI